MSESDFTYKPQDVNYLGFLEAQLRDLQGIDALAYELIQNADDVRDESGRPQTTWLSFDVTDEALIVENDGVFRSVDFERLQNIASGGKREEAGTTGAFGLGFIAVYQITDAPEIFSNGIHWTIRPQAPPDRRIRERRVETEGTRFRLPWAFDAASLVRRTLRIEAVQPQDLDRFAEAIAGAIELAALFLQQLQVLEVRRNGELLRRIEREAAGGRQIVLHDSRDSPATWLLFQGDFAEEAGTLRAQYSWQIEAHRHSNVRLALPTEAGDSPGRLFAVLPTDTTFPVPLHISADFFPTTDRKRIHFDGGYQARWNEAAIRCAAQTLAQNLSLLPDLLGHRGLWQLLQKTAETEQMANRDLLPAVFAAFWRVLAPQLNQAPIAYTATEEWRPAPDVRLVAREALIPLLQALHIAAVHPDLIPYSNLMQRDEVGARQLNVEDLVSGLMRVGLTRPTPLHEAPAPLRNLSAWQEVWALIDRLLRQSPGPRERAAALEQLGRCALVLSNSMTLSPLNRVYRGDSEAQTLFPDVAWLHPELPTDSFPGRYVPQFGARQAVERLADTPIDRLEHAWRMGQLDLPRLFRWFESRQIEIFADDPSLQKEIRRLPLCPVEGELRPLGDLYLPGGFEDPLRVAGVVDLQAIGGRREFLRDLGMRELDFDTYLHSYLPRLLAQDPHLPSDALHRLVRLLAERLGQFRDDEGLQDTLSTLPLVACMDGSFRPANVVYESREAAELLGEGAHVAEPPPGEAVRALQHWLGVRREPQAADIVQALLGTARAWEDTALDAQTMDLVRRRWQRLDTLLRKQRLSPAQLGPLRDQKVLPNRSQRLARPSNLILVDQASPLGEAPELPEYLLPTDVDYANAALAAGVRRLSQALQLHIVGEGESAPLSEVQERIRRRRPLIVRLLRTEGESDDVRQKTTFLETIRTVALPQLQVQHRLPVAGTVLVSEPEPVDAALAYSPGAGDAAATLYVSSDLETIPWTAIARELARAIKREETVGSLAIGIREVLAASTYEDAQQTLDELGYI